jgi:hypothetical protein
MSSNTDGDGIFAFDVSQKLRDAAEEGDKISFLLEAISNSSAEISFLPRESGQGPCLMIMPYPETLLPDRVMLNSSTQLDQTSELFKNMSDMDMQIKLDRKDILDMNELHGD